MLWLTFSYKLDWSSFIISIATSTSKKIRALICSMKFLCISMNLQYGYTWNTVLMTRLLHLAATWNCWISYKNRYAGLLAILGLPFLNPWLIIKM